MSGSLTPLTLGGAAILLLVWQTGLAAGAGDEPHARDPSDSDADTSTSSAPREPAGARRGKEQDDRQAPPTQPTPPAELPASVIVGRPTELAIDGDRSVRVTHSAAETTHAIVYLHGMCGNPKGADPWADLAAQYGTLITVRANVPCPDRPGYKWPKDIEAIQARISAALLAVKTERQGQLQTTDVSLFGYSQGAHRAERLAAAYPHLYRTVALGGPPTSPTPERLRHARHIAILGGELENTTHMMDGYLDLVSSGLDAKFYLLPRAGHGSYGPEGRRVVAKVFGDLFRQAPREATWPPHHSLAPDDSASADGSR